MTNKYLKFISDDHLIECISNLFDSYTHAKNQITKKHFYSNKIDTIKLTFDSKFNNLDEETLIKSEIARQIDKSINNAIGTFHEEILGGISGYKIGNKSGYDIKAIDNSLFAEIKNKHNTMNSGGAESVFQKLKKFANDYPNSKCYLVEILSKSSFNENWSGKINGKNYSHQRVFRISGDQFYSMLSGEKEALFNLYKVLPKAIDDFLKKKKDGSDMNENSVINEIQKDISESKRNILDQITYDNFKYYYGFDKL